MPTTNLPRIGDLEKSKELLSAVAPLNEDLRSLSEQLSCVRELPECSRIASLPGWRPKLLGKLLLRQQAVREEKDKKLTALHCVLDRLAAVSPSEGISYSFPHDYRTVVGAFFKHLNEQRNSWTVDPVFSFETSAALSRLIEDVKLYETFK